MTVSNIETTVIDAGSRGPDGGAVELLTLAGATTLKAGTILARNTATQKLQLYVKGGSSNGNGIPKAILCDAASKDGAGDLPVLVLTDGTVKKERLVIHADGDDSNIDATVRDLLRATAIIPDETAQLDHPDNLGGAAPLLYQFVYSGAVRVFSGDQPVVT